MKRASYKWLLLGGSLIIPAAMVEAGAGGMPSGSDTTRVIAEATSQALDDNPADLGLLEYFLKRKQPENGQQPPAGADVPQAYNGPLEELGLIDLLLGKKAPPSVMAAGVPVANEPVSEPVPEPLPEGGLINYFVNRRNTATKPVAGPTQAEIIPQTKQAKTKSSIRKTSRVPAKYATVVESAAISEDLLRIKVVLGQLPRSALASLEQSAHLVTTAKMVNNEVLVENTDPQPELAQKHDSPGPATAADIKGKGLLNILLQRQH